MAINGCLTLAWLEEDDPSRGFFRVRPAALIAPESKVYVHDGEYGDEDFLRVVPDKNEMSTFKQRMRTLGKLCLIDLRAHSRENDKIRQNKNYAAGNDRNPFMIYSDVIREVPDGLVCEICPSAGEAMTKVAFRREGGELIGPYRDDGGAWTECEDCARVPLESCGGCVVELTDTQGGIATLLIRRVEAPQDGGADRAVQAVQPCPIEETPSARETETVQPSTNAETAPGERQSRVRIKEEVSYAFKRLKEQMGLNPRKGRSLSEVVDEQWRMRKQEELAQTVPPQATSEPAQSPAERAIDAINAAWEFTGAQATLVEGIISNDELVRRIVEVYSPGEHARPTDARMIEMEAERLRLITEMDGLKRRTREMKAEVLREMRAENEVDAEALKSSIVLLETELENRRAEISALEKQGKELKAEIAAALDAPVSKRLAGMIVESKIKELLRPESGAQANASEPALTDVKPPVQPEPKAEIPEFIAPDALIDTASMGMSARGWQMARDDVTHMLIALAMNRPLILTGFAGSDDVRFAEALGETLADESLSECVRLNAPGAGASAPKGRGVCAALSHPDGAPIDAARLDAGFLMLDCTALCLPCAAPEVKPVSEESWTKLLEGELSINAGNRLRAMCARLNEFGAKVPHGALIDCARYVAAATGRMSGGEEMALDYAIATRLLPPVIAAAPAELLSALPDMVKGMDKCAKLLRAPLPLDR